MQKNVALVLMSDVNTVNGGGCAELGYKGSVQRHDTENATEIGDKLWETRNVIGGVQGSRDEVFVERRKNADEGSKCNEIGKYGGEVCAAEDENATYRAQQ